MHVPRMTSPGCHPRITSFPKGRPSFVVVPTSPCPPAGHKRPSFVVMPTDAVALFQDMDFMKGLVDAQKFQEALDFSAGDRGRFLSLRGRCYLHLDEPDKAAAEFQELLEQTTDSAEEHVRAQAYLAMCLVRMDKTEQAMALLEQVRKTRVQDKEAELVMVAIIAQTSALMQGMVHLMDVEGDPVENLGVVSSLLRREQAEEFARIATMHFKRTVKFQAHVNGGRKIWARLLVDQERLLDAAGVLESAMKEESDANTLAQFAQTLAFIYMRLDRAVDAVPLFRLALSSAPASDCLETVRLWDGLGNALLQKGDLQEAKRAVLKASVMASHLFTAPHLELVSTIRSRAKVFVASREMASAATWLQKALDMHRKLADASGEMRGDMLMDMADVYHEMKEPKKEIQVLDDAVKAFEGASAHAKALKARERLAPGPMQEGATLMGIFNSDEGIEAMMARLDQMGLFDPGWPEASKAFLEGRFLEVAPEADRVLGQLKARGTKVKSLQDAHVVFGMSCMAVGEYDRAIALLEAGHALRPRNATHLFLALGLSARAAPGDHQAIMRHCGAVVERGILKAEPVNDDGFTAYVMGMTLMSRGNMAETESKIKEGVDLLVKDEERARYLVAAPVMLKNLGKVRRLMGNREGALVAFKKAAEIAGGYLPGDHPVLKALVAEQE